VDTANVAASTQSAVIGPITATSNPAPPGPTTWPMFLSIVVAALARVRSSSGTITGTTESYAGWNNASPAPIRNVRSASDQIGALVPSAISSSTATVRITSLLIISRSLSSRSANTPPNTISRARARNRAPNTTPSEKIGSDRVRARLTTAIGNSWSPMMLTS
jgi:hypothetical protein